MIEQRDERVHNIGPTILDYAEECECFTRGQAYYMRPATAENTIDHVLRKLVDFRELHADLMDPDKFTLSPLKPFDENRVKALWVALVHKGDRILNHDPSFWISHGRTPFSVSYILNNVLYDVMVLTYENRVNLTLIERNYKDGQEADEGPHKYVFVIEEESLIERLPEITVPHIFAVVNGKNLENPVRFIRDEAEEDTDDQP